MWFIVKLNFKNINVKFYSRDVNILKVEIWTFIVEMRSFKIEIEKLK